MPEISDQLIVIRIKEGNKQSFDFLFLKYYNPLFRYAFNICKNKFISEDSVQQTFIKIWKNSSLLSSEIPVGKILFSYTHNQVIDEIRKEKIRKKYQDSYTYNQETTTTDIKDENKLRTLAIIESAIDRLPEKTKEIFRLAKQDGLSYDEIAAYLKISQKTVENQMGNAYKKLREYLNPYKEIL